MLPSAPSGSHRLIFALQQAKQRFIVLAIKRVGHSGLALIIILVGLGSQRKQQEDDLLTFANPGSTAML